MDTLLSKLRHQPHLVKTGIIIVIISLLPLDILFIYSIKNINKIFPNIYVNQIDLGGKTKQEATNLLIQAMEVRPVAIQLVGPNRIYSLTEAELNVEYDINKTISTAYQVGRNQQFTTNVNEQFSLLKHPQTIPLSVTLDKVKLDEFVASLAAELEEPVIPPTITIVNHLYGKTASVSAGKTGQELDIPTTKYRITHAFASQNYESVPLPITQINKPVSSQQVATVEAIANQILGKTLVLQQDTNEWRLEDEELINFLSVYDEFDHEKIASWTAELAKVVDRDPQNALFQFDGNRVSEFQPGKPGFKLDVEQTVNAIEDGIKTLTALDKTSHTITLQVTVTQPEVTTDKVNNLGIKELIGKGESWFSHSIPGRVHNVSLAASKFNGVLVAPGETFSFLKTVGEIDAQHGYKPAYIIQNGRTVLGDGGGVCQVSSTLFRAVLNAGLNITERHAHAYRVSYYEENYDPGVDATVFAPSVDLKFINDTPAHILIQSIVDTENYYMRFEFYGTKDGRQVEMSKPIMWSQTPPPPDVYQDDPTLSVGVVKQVDWKAWGAKTSFSWKVTKDSQVIHEKTFYSNYRPWAAVFLRGTKTE